ncbi:hypothetical protein KR044_002735 [Drosophila immigrans]|nr:hypothetical protein KR044_002735 [Drosophila immigrans]
MAKISNWDKFVLLLWKNWVLQFAHKVQLVIELLLPIVFASLMVLVRVATSSKDHKEVIYPSFDIDSLDQFNASMDAFGGKTPTYSLYYAPKTDLLETLVGDAARSLGMTHQGFADGYGVEDAVAKSNAFAGIEFQGDWSQTMLPNDLKFKLRFPFFLRTSRNFVQKWYTGNLFSPHAHGGPRELSIFGASPNYVTEGFVAIQHALSMAFIRHKSPLDVLPDVVMQPFPYPAFKEDVFISMIQDLLALLILLSFVYPAVCIVRFITTEKEKQLKEVMKIMGLNNWLHWTAWFVKSFLLLLVPAIVIAILYKVPYSGESILPYSDITAFIFILIIYIITMIMFCFMIAPIFNKASTAAAVTGLLCFLTYLPYTMLLLNYGDTDITSKLGWSLLPNTAMGFVCNLIVKYELKGVGLQWSNLFEPVNADDTLTMGGVLIMMIISCVIFMIICLYIEQVMPSTFGVSRVWYFPFTKSYWCSSRREDSIVEDLSAYQDHDERHRQTFEVEPDDKNVGLQIRNLKKKFGDRTAVNNLSINMFEDEITVLLGHNGAGKTTTISMLTGMIKPTSGTAIINGSDIRTNLQGARMSLGLCPQHNVLFDEMSVSNHLRFFSRMKGLKGEAMNAEVHKYLALIELEDKAKVHSKNLSGGMQRKLALCCALCGDTKVVLCDEPSSGMDPAARRQLWELLQKEKAGRTLLLTTHFMDEADVLGDRIAIMCDGELMCYGTSFFLKKHYGSGYTLICVKEQNCVVDDVTALLGLYIPNIEPKSNIGTELVYALPDQYSDRFEKMLGALEERSEELGLGGYGVGITSMEEVFMKVGAETNAKPDGPSKSRLESGGEVAAPPAAKVKYADRKVQPAGDDDDDDNDSLPSGDAFTQRHRSMRGMNLTKNQYTAMMLKKMLYTYRNRLLFLIQNIMPIVFVILTAVVSKKAAESRYSTPITYSLEQYPSTVTVLENADNLDAMHMAVSEQYENYIKTLGGRHSFETTDNFIKHILDLKDDQARVDHNYMAAVSFTNDNITAWHNREPLHAAPLTVNLVHNAIARYAFNANADIQVTNAPYSQLPTDRLNQNFEMTFGTNLSSNLCFCMCFISSMYILFPIKERESRAKLLQFVSGVRVLTFWLTQLIWDYITFTFTCIVIIITILCLQEQGFTTFVQLMRVFLILLVFSFAALPYTYTLSLLFSDPAMGFARNAIINIFMGMALSLVYIILVTTLDAGAIVENIAYIVRIFPHFSLFLAVYNTQKLITNELLCEQIQLPPVLMCELVPNCCNLPSFLDVQAPGILTELIYMVGVGIVFFLFLILHEYRILNEFVYMIRKRTIKPPPPPELGYFNEDVEKERQRILNMTKEEVGSTNLVIDRMTKYYKSFLAVNQVSLCVEAAECFGLLGVNGAGKTSTFKMLTGDQRIDFGTAHVQGYSMETDAHRVFKRIGYCPQFDALFDDLTGREVLRIYCLLRGIEKSSIKRITEELAKALGFLRHLDKRTLAYSGGNKRKLSTGIALLGGPSVVYLDEPTTGMDPAARRQLWNVVCACRDNGKTIILTSHSMEECEALCTRLAIMVNGELKCIGSTQHLKNKYSKGLVLKIKVYRGPDKFRISQVSRGSRYRTQDSEDSVPSTPVPYANTSALSLQDSTASTSSLQRNPSGSVNDAPPLQGAFALKKRENDGSDANHVSNPITDVKNFVHNKFPTAILQEEHRSMLTYYIPLSDIKWSKIFGLMESHRSSLSIEDYSISQTTLEEIFLDFAKFQREDPRNIVKQKKKKKTPKQAGAVA